MDYEKTIEAFLLNPSETLSTELKEWIDVSTDEGKEKLIKSSIALYNNNGGYIAIGFKNDGAICKNHQGTALDQIRIQFNFDEIQAIISRYSSTKIETKIFFHGFENAYYPFIFIPSGVRTPAFVKADLYVNNGKDKLLQKGKIYIRTLSSNGTVSSSEPRTQKDWDKLLNICLENKETDIAKFFQNNLTDGQLKKLKDFLLLPQNNNEPLQKDAHNVKNCLSYGYKEYDSIAKTKKLPDHGSFQIAFTIKNEIEKITISDSLLQIIRSSNPRPSGWPLWVVLQNSADEEKKPHHFSDRWQAFIENSYSLDFWIITEKKCFYHYRALRDDLNGSTTTQANEAKLKEIDFVWQVENVSDAIASALAFAQALNGDESTILSLAFKWTGLKNRHLTAWAHPGRNIYCESKSLVDDVIYEVDIPINVTRENIVTYTYEIVSRLFLVFGGYDRIQRNTIAEIVILYLKWK
jgi:hypothetical protein